MLHKGAARGAARPRHGAAGRLRRLKPLEAVGQKATQPMSGSWRTSGTLEQDSRTLQTRSARSLHRSAEVKELARHVHPLRPAQPGSSDGLTPPIFTHPAPTSPVCFLPEAFAVSVCTAASSRPFSGANVSRAAARNQ
jgi:hypothetical protein